MYDWLDRFLNSGWDLDNTPHLLMRRVRTLATTSTLMCVLSIPFIYRAYQWEISTRMVTVPVAFSLCLFTLIGLRLFKRYWLMANFGVVAIYVAGLGAMVSGGGVGSVTVGWLMLVPLLAGILLGKKGGLLWGVVVLLTIYFLFWLQTHGWNFEDQTPPAFRSSQYLIQAFGLTSGLLVLMGSYMSQIGHSEQVLAEKNASLTQEIQRAEQAEHETQLAIEAKTRFLANMSHELKTPLNSILGFSNRLQIKVQEKLDEREQGALKAVIDHGEHMLHLVDDLLALSQIDANELALRKGPANMQEVLFRVVAEVATVAETYNLKLNFMAEDGLTIHCDGERVTQALSSIVRHCVKYASQDTVQIKAVKSGAETALIQMSFASVPLAEPELSRLFDRYNHLHSKIDRDVGCSGLALVLSEELIQLHGGEVKAKVSEAGEMQFDVRLPVGQS